jgi:hypothetical protein
MKTSFSLADFKAQRRQIGEGDLLELLERIIVDRRVCANATLAAASIICHIDSDNGFATVTDDALNYFTAGKIDNRKIEFARRSLKRTGWMIWSKVSDVNDKDTFEYAFPSLGRVERLQ